eukprot:m.17004 g.17004  ORF g.17004 m.17004 type:complete len:772 (-) comp7287_c0_seq2:101-2416(-)
MKQKTTTTTTTTTSTITATTTTKATTTAKTTTTTPTASSLSSFDKTSAIVKRFNCGVDNDVVVTDRYGHVWSSCFPYVTSQVDTYAVDADLVQDEPREVLASELSAARRIDSLDLRFPIDASEHDSVSLELWFTEIYVEHASEGDRVMDIFINDRLLMEGLDVVQRASGLWRSTTLQVDAVPQGGVVTLSLRRRIKAPKINGVVLILHPLMMTNTTTLRAETTTTTTTMTTTATATTATAITTATTATSTATMNTGTSIPTTTTVVGFLAVDNVRCMEFTSLNATLSECGFLCNADEADCVGFYLSDQSTEVECHLCHSVIEGSQTQPSPSVHIKIQSREVEKRDSGWPAVAVHVNQKCPGIGSGCQGHHDCQAACETQGTSCSGYSAALSLSSSGIVITNQTQWELLPASSSPRTGSVLTPNHCGALWASSSTYTVHTHTHRAYQPEAMLSMSMLDDRLVPAIYRSAIQGKSCLIPPTETCSQTVCWYLCAVDALCQIAVYDYTTKQCLFVAAQQHMSDAKKTATVCDSAVPFGIDSINVAVKAKNAVSLKTQLLMELNPNNGTAILLSNESRSSSAPIESLGWLRVADELTAATLQSPAIWTLCTAMCEALSDSSTTNRSCSHALSSHVNSTENWCVLGSRNTSKASLSDNSSSLPVAIETMEVRTRVVWQLVFLGGQQWFESCPSSSLQHLEGHISPLASVFGDFDTPVSALVDKCIKQAHSSNVLVLAACPGWHHVCFVFATATDFNSAWWQESNIIHWFISFKQVV